MAQIKSLNRVKCTTATTGTGTAAVGAALSSFFTPDDAGAVNGGIYKTLWEDGNDWEISKSTYTTSGATLTRTLVQSSTGSLLNLSGSATVAFIDDADDENGGRVITPPQGRLTPSTGTPVLTASVTGAGTIYYALHNGNRAPIPDKDGFGLVMREFTELSQALTDNTKSPAAAGAHSCYDLFLWDDAGTLRCTRGPAWTRAQTFTVTIASPAVFTATAHGLLEGMPVVLSTTGALPTGLAAATVYFVIAAGLTANAFEVSATLGGSAINTSGSQSGTHTVTDSNIVRGTGAGTTELTRLSGLWVNANAITNGPGASKGLYVGTIRTNGSSTVDMIFGGTGAAGGESSSLGVWNAYNRIVTQMVNYDNTASWNYTTLTWRCKNGNVANRIQVLAGLSEDHIQAISDINTSNGTANVARFVSIGFNSTVAPANALAGGFATIGRNQGPGQVSGVSHLSTRTPLGYNAYYPIEQSVASGTTSWLGTDGYAIFSVRCMA